MLEFLDSTVTLISMPILVWGSLWSCGLIATGLRNPGLRQAARGVLMLIAAIVLSATPGIARFADAFMGAGEFEATAAGVFAIDIPGIGNFFFDFLPGQFGYENRWHAAGQIHKWSDPLFIGMGSILLMVLGSRSIVTAILRAPTYESIHAAGTPPVTCARIRVIAWVLCVLPLGGWFAISGLYVTPNVVAGGIGAKAIGALLVFAMVAYLYSADSAGQAQSEPRAVLAKPSTKSSTRKRTPAARSGARSTASSSASQRRRAQGARSTGH